MGYRGIITHILLLCSSLSFAGFEVIEMDYEYRAAPEKRTQDDQVWSSDSSSMHSSFLGNLVGLVVGQDDMKNPNFREQALKTGLPIGEVFNATSVGRKVARGICGLPEDNNNGDIREHQNEVDAIRHFATSAHLAAHLSEPKANAIMSAREKKRSVGKHDLMDQYNNSLGFEFGRYLHFLKQQREVSEKELVQKIEVRAKQLYHTGKFAVLSSGGKFSTDHCTGNPHYPNANHKRLDPSSFLVIDNTVPDSCNVPLLMRPCRERKNSRALVMCIERQMPNALEKYLAEHEVVIKRYPERLNPQVQQIRERLNQCQNDVARIRDILDDIREAHPGTTVPHSTASANSL